jgi:tetratricopeptide (TPR) repeat protein
VPVSKSDVAPSADDPQPQDERRAAAEPPAQASAAQETVKSRIVAASESDAPPADDLPEWEPLTPEFLEEEAIRGDFMLRWAAVLLAVLFGWTVVDRTDILVDVKSGQYLAAHGILPPATDVFSATARERRWVNLSWLWDLLVGGIDRLIGPAGLSLLSAVISGATFWFVVRTSVPGVSTWWGSICAVLAVVACFPSLTASPEIVTLLGTALLLWLLFRWRWEPARSLWPIAGLFLLWGNLDARAWMGGVILLMFTLGTWLDGFRTLPADEPALPVRRLAVVAACSVLALVAHPFLWETWLAPLRLYGFEYPGLRAYVSEDVPFASDYYSAASPSFWEELNLFNAVALLLMATAGVTLLLNRERLRLASVFVLLAVNVIGIAGGRELAVASIVNCIIAGINGQQWYRAIFRQTYRVEAAEILFSRAGRALTVLAVFALAFAAVSGHLMGAQGRRVGVGLAPQLAETIDSYRSVLADAFDDRAFNFRLEQGDVLIWIGMQPFIDSRIGLYGGADSLIPLHLGLRQALRSSTSSDPDAVEQSRQFWTTAFDEHQILQVLPRLSGDAPDYYTYLDLLNSPDWQLTHQGAATAVFYRTDTDNDALAEYLAEHDATQFVTRLLRNEEAGAGEAVPRGIWPRAPSFYDAFVYLRRRATPNGVQRANHWHVLREALLRRRQLDDAIAVTYASLRDARAGLRVDPHNAQGYRILGNAYRFLEAVEMSFEQNPGTTLPASLRYYQTISALHQALEADPADLESKYHLYEVYNAHGRADLAVKYLDLVEEATGATSIRPPAHPARAEQQELNDARREELQTFVDQVREQIAAIDPTPEGRLQAAQVAIASGCPLLALGVFEEDLTLPAANVLARVLMGVVLLEVGRTSEALEQLESLRGTPVAEQSPQWAEMTAYGHLAADELATARTTLADSHSALLDRMAADILNSALLQFSGPVVSSDGDIDWGGADGLAAVRHLQTMAVVNSSLAPLAGHNELIRALIAVEMGDGTDADDLFEQLVARDPDSPARPLIERYYGLLTGEELPPAPEKEDIPIEPDLSEEGPPDGTDQPAQETQPPTDDADQPARETQQPANEPDRPPTEDDLINDSTAPGDAGQKPADVDSLQPISPNPDPRK